MTLTLRPETERLIDEQVRAGRFPTAEAVVDAAVAELSIGTEGGLLDDDDVAALNAAEAEGDRGDVTDLDTFRAEVRQRYGGA